MCKSRRFVHVHPQSAQEPVPLILEPEELCYESTHHLLEALQAAVELQYLLGQKRAIATTCEVRMQAPLTFEGCQEEMYKAIQRVVVDALKEYK